MVTARIRHCCEKAPDRIPLLLIPMCLFLNSVTTKGQCLQRCSLQPHPSVFFHSCKLEQIESGPTPANCQGPHSTHKNRQHVRVMCVKNSYTRWIPAGKLHNAALQSDNTSLIHERISSCICKIGRITFSNFLKIL